MFQDNSNFYGRIGVLMGGNSSERTISLKSGEAVASALKEKKQIVIPIDCQGSKSEIESKIRSENIDIAFIVLHGRGGEDGFIQTLLEGMGINYIGSSPESSLKAFNKIESKKIFFEKGVPTPKYAVINKENWESQTHHFSYPFFIKPIDEGSSIGVKKITNNEQMRDWILSSFSDYKMMLVEEAIIGKEITVGILGSEALPVIELKPKRDFYDYMAKYTKGMTEYLVPAPIDPEIAKKLQQISLAAHRSLGLRDFSRVDLMVDGSGSPYVLEVNTIPGFTETSLLPKAAKEAGIEFGDLCLTLLQLAKERCAIHGKEKQEKIR